MAVTQEMVHDARRLFDDIIDDRERLAKRLERAEEVIIEFGFVSGMLDVCGGSAGSLLELAKNARDRLRDASDKYWLFLKNDEEPIKFRDKPSGSIQVMNEKGGQG